jgi:hypothetical protein
MIKTPLASIKSFNRLKLLWLKALKYPGFIVGGVIIICVLVVVSFPDPLINYFLKERISKAFTEAYPEDSIHIGRMHYNIWKNRLGSDTITLKTKDYTLNVSFFSVTGIGLMKILRQSNFTPNTLVNSVFDVQNVELYFRKSQQVLRLGTLHISVPDSELIADSIKYHSILDEEHFFAISQFRQSRYRLNIPQIKIISLDCLALLQGKALNAKNIHISDALVDILVNMDKPYNMNSTNPQMPHEAFASIKKTIKVDSMIVINGQLKYYERYKVGAKPGVVPINKINISVGRIANHTSHPDATIIRGEGLLMNTGKMKLYMAIPLNSKNFSLQYSGSLGRMDVTELNSFIEPGEHQRLKSGILKSALFNINVNSGVAKGTLRAEYSDLTIDVLNKNTGSEKGLFDRIFSLFGKIFVVRGTNMPDEEGSIKIGEIKYTRRPDDYFFQFVWFALRNGVADLVGFPKK